MTPTSEERREVAGLIRAEAADFRRLGEKYGDVWTVDLGDVPAIFQNIARYAGLDGVVRADALFDRLADLIDLPKAKREDAGNYWLCGHCGAFSRKDAVTDCISVIPSRCCGNCGREWER